MSSFFMFLDTYPLVCYPSCYPICLFNTFPSRFMFYVCTRNRSESDNDWLMSNIFFQVNNNIIPLFFNCRWWNSMVFIRNTPVKMTVILPFSEGLDVRNSLPNSPHLRLIWSVFLAVTKNFNSLWCYHHVHRENFFSSLNLNILLKKKNFNSLGCIFRQIQVMNPPALV